MNATDFKQGVKEIWWGLRLMPFAYDQSFSPLKNFGLSLAGETVEKTLGVK